MYLLPPPLWNRDWTFPTPTRSSSTNPIDTDWPTWEVHPEGDDELVEGESGIDEDDVLNLEPEEGQPEGDSAQAELESSTEEDGHVSESEPDGESR